MPRAAPKPIRNPRSVRLRDELDDFLVAESAKQHRTVHSLMIDILETYRSWKLQERNTRKKRGQVVPS